MVCFRVYGVRGVSFLLGVYEYHFPRFFTGHEAEKEKPLHEPTKS